MPPFAELLVRKDLWYYVFLGVVTLTLIDGVESLATAMAIDRIDPFRRKSQPNRLLFAMAISNIASSLIGGLTIIPGGVKSKANIASGGRTLWANFTNSICLIIYMVFARKLINLIPLGVLASVLIYTGWKMCEPLVWNHIAHIGKEQLGIFAFTIVATLATDLLIGIIAGTIAKLALNTLFHRRALGAGGLQEDQRPSLIQGMGGFFRNPVCQRELVGDQYHLYFDKPLVCFNSMHVSSELEKVPAEAKSVTIHLNPTVSLIDHTSCENLLSAVHEFTRNGVPAQVIGLDALQPRSEYHACVHVAAPSVAVAPAI